MTTSSSSPSTDQHGGLSPGPPCPPNAGRRHGKAVAPLDSLLTSAAYKWLFSPRGTAFGVVRPERLGMLRPLYAGWYAGDDRWTSIYGPPLRLAKDARRLDISPAWLAWAGTVPALELLTEVGIATIHRHDLALANALRGRLRLPPG
jgi:selenocysteine lyase/cysteine desulfurase